MYILKSEDLMDVGRISNSPTVNYVKYFTTMERAAAYAVRDHGRSIKWNVASDTHISSGDVGYEMYDISEIIVES